MKEQIPKPSKFINLRTDFGFKKLFFEDPNKDLLIAFLNALFKGRKVIKDLTYNKTEFPGDIASEGNVIFDLACTGEDGERFIIEVQRTKKDNFKKRALFYTSRLISNQAPVGNRSVWNYDIDEVFLVALLDGFVLEGTPEKEYLHDICLCNRETGETFYEGLGYIYIELLKFVKDEQELETDLDRWLYVLKNMNDLQKIPVFLRKTIFEKVFKIATYSNLTKEEKMLYDLDLKKQWDDYSALETAKKEGGKEKSVEFVRNLILKFGFTDLQIVEAADVSLDFVQKVRASLKSKK
jgi:predicted transposase/invertase (TIGR01784 family)